MEFDNISWDEYFMSIAILSAKRSKDPNTKVGACIVSDEHKVLSLGYNGMPTGIYEQKIPWAREAESQLDTKYPYVCHAELNAILNSNHDLQGSTLYVTLFPCNECTKACIQAGIKKIIYLSDKYHDTEMEIAARRLLDMAGIEYVPYQGRVANIEF